MKWMCSLVETPKLRIMSIFRFAEPNWDTAKILSQETNIFKNPFNLKNYAQIDFISLFSLIWKFFFKVESRIKLQVDTKLEHDILIMGYIQICSGIFL
ncbi:hypothetical protein HZS_4675 [Henneguya salminicola]|nr:hypothetical protein HZS_4675 [Henneguya salminicola]